MTSACVVFVVDDDPSVRASLKFLVSTVGLQVESFDSAEAFLNKKPPDGPSCLVLDVRLRGMSGLDLQRELAARDLRIPIVFITGHGDIPMSVRAMKAGAVEFLSKPFSRPGSAGCHSRCTRARSCKARPGKGSDRAATALRVTDSAPARGDRYGRLRFPQ